MKDSELLGLAALISLEDSEQPGLAPLRRRPTLSLKMPNSIGIFLTLDSRPISKQNGKNKKPILSNEFLIFHGGPAGARTRDLRIKSPALYQLSYRSVNTGSVRNIVNFYENANFLWCFVSTPEYDREEEVAEAEEGEEEGDRFGLQKWGWVCRYGCYFWSEDFFEFLTLISLRDMDERTTGRARDAIEGCDID